MTDQLSQPTQNIGLEITRSLAADCETVFDYFTSPEKLSRWFAPDPSMKTIVHELDLKVGGKYKIEMANEAEGASYIVVGEYKTIDRPNQVEFSWHWESEPEDEVSVVSIQLKPNGDQTELTIVHNQFDTQESCDKHGQGWDGCLNRLVSAVEA